jgi:hypothetical protein
MELALGVAFIASVIAYRNKLIELHDGRGRRGEMKFQFIQEDGKQTEMAMEAANEVTNRTYRAPIRTAPHLPVPGIDSQVFTTQARYILKSPELRAAYFANYVEAVDRDHIRLQLTHQKYPYSQYRPIISVLGGVDDMAVSNIYDPRY